MTNVSTHPLKVFLCHASGDKPPVRDLYKRLVAEGVDAWLDQEKLLPGQDWRREIPKAVREADVVVVCLSNKSITREGYVQKEIKFALDIAEEKPEGTIFLIPARLEDCPVPERLSRWQWVDLYEENGFIKLLRSLKLRAGAVGATVEPTSYEDSGKETERRIKQLYTEGLAAFYTEDWDRACQRFQIILSEHPNHKNAAEKMAEAERQRNLAKLYAQATDAVRSENWQVAINTLEELSQKSADYKDVTSLLKNARKQEQLDELYTEAKTLHVGEQWEAVVKVFEQISVIDPAYPDQDGLLPSAQREVAELKQLADLNDLYSNAVSEMDAGQWYEARRLLERLHKAQTGFLDTERLLRKVEDEITKVEEKRKQNDEINTLYEQAHGLLRSKKWRKALDKMDEIQGLDDQFVDKDGISEKAKTELAREEQEAQRQNELAAMYSEAVRLLREENYQQALEKWQQVKKVDPKYPDRQWVQRTARKRLTETAKPVQIKPRFVMSKSLWMGIVGVVVLVAVIVGMVFSGRGKQEITASPTFVSDASISVTPRASEVAPTQTLEPGLLYKEDFETGQANNWSLDPGWQVARDGSNHVLSGEGFNFAEYEAGDEWVAYLVRFKLKLIDGGIHLDYRRIDKSNRAASVVSAGYFVEFRGNYLNLSKMISGEWVKRCAKDVQFAINTWHDVEVVADGSDFLVYIDGALAMQCPDADPVLGGTIWFDTLENSKALVDDIEIESLPMTDVASDPTMYDDFNNPAYNDSYNKSLWVYQSEWTGPFDLSNFVVSQNNGKLSIEVSKQSDFRLVTGSSIIRTPTFFEARLYLDPNTTDKDSHLYIEINNGDGRSNCGIYRTGDYAQRMSCWSNYYGENVDTKLGLDGIQPGWHILRFEIDPETMIVYYVVDGRRVAQFDPKESIPDHINEFKRSSFYFVIALNNFGPSKNPIGYFDYVRIGALEQDPTVYDNFDNPYHDGAYDPTKWTYMMHDADGSMYQENGILVFSQDGTKDRWQFLRGTSIDSYPLVSTYFESALKLDPSAKGGDVQLGFNSNYGAAVCGVSGPDARAYCWCQTGSDQFFDNGFSVQTDSWHFFRIEVIQSKAEFTFYIDSRNIGSCSLPNPAGSLDKTAIFDVGGWMSSKSVKGYIDYVRIGELAP